MSGEIINEVDIFFRAIILGVVFALIYDFIRIIRRIVFKSFIIMGLEDILYWLIMAVMTCVFLYKVNGGVIRSYIITGIAAGMILYELSIGRFAVKYLTIALKFILRKICKIFEKIWKMLHWGLKKVFKPIRILCSKINVKILRKHKENSKIKRSNKTKDKNTVDNRIKVKDKNTRSNRTKVKDKNIRNNRVKLRGSKRGAGIEEEFKRKI
ncbi:MAG: spore cortex biosynthesis protein YabQ [Lachnospiraceae bacterium]|nr:spore cortex biosynthesis protein YabQ [Clostridiales bacterium]MDD6293232.1 spore cortex biosynthesis protein YabQ [Eubacteriales bacterium]MDY2607303.1 spore cortex biosynthesis protein YabQ [Lachnospiraceae bacterium]